MFQGRQEIRQLQEIIREKDKIIQAKDNEISALRQRLDDCKLSTEDGYLNVPRDEANRICKKEIGRGSWGAVYSGKLRGEDVAIKKAHKDTLHKETVKMLKREIMIMAQIQHPNLVRFIAAVLDEDVERGKDSPIIISELLDMNLRVAYEKFDLGRNLIPIFRDVAYALHYLHQHREPIIHRDVSAPNVLLQSLPNNLYRAKVSDFGSANLIKQSSTAGAGAIAYCAPEMFPPNDISVRPPRQTTKVDIFSYGILLLEVILKKMPTTEARYDMLKQIEHQWKAMHKLIIHCTKQSPSDRPTMTFILNKLHTIVNKDMRQVSQQQSYNRSRDDTASNQQHKEQLKECGNSLSKKQMHAHMKPLRAESLHKQAQDFYPMVESSNHLDNQSLLASTGSGPPVNLGCGYLIQIDSNEADNPRRYGIIKWIGLLPGVRGEIAGIQLDEPMEGCTDGTFSGTDQKFFDCPDGRGMYYPLNGLVPDSRYAPEIFADGNPLRDVIEEESDSHEVNIDKYIGESRGIQGHQNSCYLDATLFGLFALTTEFDDMFLQNYSMSDVGKILWRNIVNPLRRHGVVKFESVMKLREQLEQLGKMKGITQDEKVMQPCADPEEFLNMMFNTSQIKPFISIRRPFGVEEEFYVQLFFKIDESLKMPSISALLHKMFQEQNISFTKIPCKLLIQVPRFWKKFKTFKKIIPTKLMNVAQIVDDDEYKLPDCFICTKPASMTCEACIMDLLFPNDSSGLCKDCCDKLHGHSLRKKGHEPQFSQEMNNLLSLSELELLSVICIETSHYVCFTRRDNRWIFFDSMANRVYDQYYIPKVVDCTDILNEWVYPEDQDMRRLLETPPQELPEYVRRFTQDIYMCVYTQPDLEMYH